MPLIRFLVPVAAILAVLSAVKTVAGFSALGPDLDAMRKHQRALQRDRPQPPPRNVIRDQDRKELAARRAAQQRIRDPRVAQLSVLKEEALAEYRAILDLINTGKLTEADARIASLSDTTLKGYVLAQRYLAKDSLVTYDQLRQWMADHADHPSAPKIHRLALAAKPKKAKAPKPPKSAGSLSRLPYRGAVTPTFGRPRLSRRQRRLAISLERQFKANLKRDRLTRATKILLRKDADRLFGSGRLDLFRTQISVRLFQFGKMTEAWGFASAAAARSGARLGQAHWIAGLSGWKLGKFAEAVKHFSAVAERKSESDWLRAGAAYWAARALVGAKEEEKAKQWLARAAAFSRTFYGMLARHRLGMKQAFSWKGAKRLDASDVRRLKESPAGRRALALIQLDLPGPAAEQLLRQYILFEEKLTRTFAQVAVYGRLSSLSYAFAVRQYRRTRELMDPALYPILRWAPAGGFRLDRALIFGLARQESAFRLKAKSPAGARGLMQLMPATAAFIANDRSLRRATVDRLYQPALNLALGQKFLRHLLNRPAIQGNLFFAVAAYNAGEGNLNKWKVRDDPLLFIEAIHLRETRGYVERVLYNLWAYRLRFGQATPSLDAVSKNKWPQYVALDGVKKPTAADKAPAKKDAGQKDQKKEEGARPAAKKSDPKPGTQPGGETTAKPDTKEPKKP